MYHVMRASVWQAKWFKIMPANNLTLCGITLRYAEYPYVMNNLTLCGIT